MMTRYNPAFAGWNFLRDSGTEVASNLMQYGEVEGTAINARLVKNVPLTMGAISRYAMKGEYASGKYGAMLKEFFEDGAATGWTYLKSVDSMRSDLRNAIDPSTARKIWDSKANVLNFKVLGDVTGGLTEMSELAIRFSEYVTLREMGKSRHEAATAAKEVSVNFNRKGSRRTLFHQMFGFFNAALQGTNKFGRLVFTGTSKQKWRARRIMAEVITAHVIGGYLNTMLNGDDDDEEVRLTDYDRMQNITFGNVKVPVAHFLRGFWGIGVMAALAQQGRKTKTEAAHKAASFLTNELMPINLYDVMVGYDDVRNELTFHPAADLKAAARPFIPTMAVGSYDVWVNEDFAGRKIYRERFGENDKRAQKDFGKRDVNPAFQALANRMFEWGGGKELKMESGKGKVIVPTNKTFSGLLGNPSVLEHLVESVFPGVGIATKDLGQTMTAWVTEGSDNVKISKIPILNKAYRPYDVEASFMSEYYTLKRLVDNWYGDKEDGAYKAARAALTGSGSAKVRRNEGLAEALHKVDIGTTVAERKAAKAAKEALETKAEMKRRIKEMRAASIQLRKKL
jgi:hypothetical protein